MSLLHRVWWSLSPAVRVALFVLATITSCAVCLGGWLIIRLQLLSPAERELLIVPMLICGLFLLGLSVFIALDSPTTSTAE